MLAPNWDLSTLLVVVEEGKGMLVDWEGEEGGIGEPVYVFGRGGGGTDDGDDVVVVVVVDDDDTLFSKEVAEEAKLHNVEEAVDEEEEKEEEILDGMLNPSLRERVVNGSTGL